MTTQKTKVKTVSSKMPEANVMVAQSDVSIFTKITSSQTTVWILSAIIMFLLMVNGCNSCDHSTALESLSTQINRSDSLQQVQYNSLVKDLGAYVGSQNELSKLKGKDEGQREESKKQVNITVKNISSDAR